jgi:hypothetical protein
VTVLSSLLFPVQTSVGKFKSVEVVPLPVLLVQAAETIGDGL